MDENNVLKHLKEIGAYSILAGRRHLAAISFSGLFSKQ